MTTVPEKPISVAISTADVQVLYACRTDPDSYMQLLLAKFKDAGVPVEGALRLRLACGGIYKVKDSMFEPQAEFAFVWLPPAYVYSMTEEMRQGALA